MRLCFVCKIGIDEPKAIQLIQNGYVSREMVYCEKHYEEATKKLREMEMSKDTTEKQANTVTFRKKYENMDMIGIELNKQDAEMLCDILQRYTNTTIKTTYGYKLASELIKFLESETK